MNASLRPLKELQSLSQAVDAVRCEVRASGVIDLAGLDTRIETLCQEIAADAVDREDQRVEFAEAIQTLIRGLDELAGVIGNQERDLRKRMRTSDRIAPATSENAG